MKWFLLAWRKCIVFRGRAHRTEYWMFVLVSALIFLGLFTFAGLMMGNEPGAKPHPVGWLGIIFMVLSLLPMISASTRRLHSASFLRGCARTRHHARVARQAGGKPLRRGSDSGARGAA